MEGARPTDLRCSPAIRALGVDPIGSAVGGTSFLLVDLPLPWPHDLSEDPRLDEVHAAVAQLARDGHPWRIQATVPSDDVPGRRIVAYHLPPGELVAGFRRCEVVVGEAAVVSTALSLLAIFGTGGLPDTDARGDLLVCTHGSRDVCCGASGTTLWKELAEPVQVLPHDVALGRTSHTGGHRFAPTAIHLPSGTWWAWLDAGLTQAVLHRARPVGELLPAYRGSSLMRTMAEQVVERAVFAEVGWAWLDHRRSARTVEVDGESRVEIDHVAPDGREGTWTGRTRVVGTSPVPTCGEPLDAAPKSAPVLELVGDVQRR